MQAEISLPSRFIPLRSLQIGIPILAVLVAAASCGGGSQTSAKGDGGGIGAPPDSAHIDAPTSLDLAGPAIGTPDGGTTQASDAPTSDLMGANSPETVDVPIPDAAVVTVADANSASTDSPTAIPQDAAPTALDVFDSAATSDAGGKTSLLAGAVPYAGNYPAAGPVTTTIGGKAASLQAFPGQVVVLFSSPVPSPADVKATVQGNGGTVVGQVPAVGLYLVSVAPGDEDSFIETVQNGQPAAIASPNLALESKAGLDASLVIPLDAANQTVDALPSTDALVAIIETHCTDPARSLHAGWVASVLRTQGLAVGYCYEVDPGANSWNDLWKTLWALVAAVDPADQTAPLFINMSVGPVETPAMHETCVNAHRSSSRCQPTTSAACSAAYDNYEQAYFKFLHFLITCLDDAIQTHRVPGIADMIAVVVAAGNAGSSMEQRLGLMRDQMQNHGDAGAGQDSVFLRNLLLVTTYRPHPDYEPKDDYLAKWTDDVSEVVVAADNPWAGYGTSFAAPYVLAQVYSRFALGKSPTPAKAIADIKAMAAADTNHLVGVESYFGKAPDVPAAADASEATLTPDDLFNCPADSVWNPQAANNNCEYIYFNASGQIITAPLAGAFPWLQVVDWPDLQTSLGTTGQWVSVKSDTCAFSQTTPSTAGATQQTDGTIGSCSDPVLNCGVQDKIGCTQGSSTAVATSGSVSMTVGGPFTANLKTKWPRLPCSDLRAENRGIQIIQANTLPIPPSP